MELWSRISDLFTRLSGYSPWEVAVELVLIWIVVYSVARFARGTRAAGALKGVLVVLIVATVVARVLGGGEAFQRLSFLYDRFLAIAAVALVVIFQPELRRALIRLGETPLLRATRSEIAEVVDEIVEACAYLSKSKFGALVVIQRQVGLEGLVEGGTPIGAALTARLLQTIFFPGSALHDLAVVVKGKVIHSASVQLPLAEPEDMPDKRFGSRHRAAVGLTRECDALVVAVSEETGHIRLVERGVMSQPLSPEDLRRELFERLRREPPGPIARTAEEVADREALVEATLAEDTLPHETPAPAEAEPEPRSASEQKPAA